MKKIYVSYILDLNCQDPIRSKQLINIAHIKGNKTSKGRMHTNAEINKRTKERRQIQMLYKLFVCYLVKHLNLNISLFPFLKKGKRQEIQ